MNENKSSRYHRYRRWAEGLAVSAQVFLLVGVVGFGLSTWLTEFSLQVAGSLGVPQFLEPTAIAAVNGFTLAVLIDLVALPFVVYSRLVLQLRYRESESRFVPWLRGYAQDTSLRAVVWMVSAVVLYAIIRQWPGAWWVLTGALFALVTIVFAHLGPVVVLPWLYDLRPLDRPGLQARLNALTHRVGTHVMAIQKWKPRVEPSRSNAALVGIGSTRRVLLSEALLADYSNDEIEVMFAHELGHYLNHDIWKMIAFEAMAVVVACGVAHLLMNLVNPVFGVADLSDVRGLPLLAIVVGSVLMFCTPIRNIISRQHERRADRCALEMTKQPEALASSLRRLAKENLAEERPSRLIEWLFYSHPPTADRLAAARAAMKDANV